jgi:Flp pilus assembly protein TadG
MTAPGRHRAALIARLRHDCGGATAIEFALVLPMIIVLVFGLIGFSMVGGAASGMHYAVEEAARCFAVNKTACGSATAARTYAAAKYAGPNVGVVFTADNTGCGFTVRATGTYRVDLALSHIDVPLSAASCYPGKVS